MRRMVLFNRAQIQSLNYARKLVEESFTMWNRRAPLLQGADAARRFADDFERRYGERPPCSEISYKDSVQLAISENRFLVIYLHSHLHDDSDKFCRRALLSPEVRGELSQNFVCWGGTMAHSEAYALANEQLKPSSFPFFGVLLCKTNAIYCIDRIEGSLDGPGLARRLSAARTANDQALTQIQRANTERRVFQDDRSMQDEAFQRAMEEDQRREADRLDRERLEAEESDRAELERAIALSVELSAEAAVSRKRIEIKPEPSAVGPEVCTLRLNFPNGSKVTRRFELSCTIQELRDFVDVHIFETNMKFKSYSVSTNMPQRVFSDYSMRLRDASVYPTSSLYVRDLDA